MESQGWECLSAQKDAQQEKPLRIKTRRRKGFAARSVGRPRAVAGRAVERQRVVEMPRLTDLRITIQNEKV